MGKLVQKRLQVSKGKQTKSFFLHFIVVKRYILRILRSISFVALTGDANIKLTYFLIDKILWISLVLPSISYRKDIIMINIKSDYPNAQPAYPPGLIKRTSSRLGRILKTITIEPAVFLISFSTNMDDVTLSQMTLYKSCSNDFPQYDNETCLNLVNDTEANSAVQKEVFLIRSIFY